MFLFIQGDKSRLNNSFLSNETTFLHLFKKDAHAQPLQKSTFTEEIGHKPVYHFISVLKSSFD